MRTSLILAILVLIARSAAAAVLRVPAEYPTIQAAIDAAGVGDTVLVADGIYSGSGNTEIDFGGKDLDLRSENGPGATIIDCAGAARAAVFQNGETGAALLEGFAIENGDPGASVPPGLGGAIYIDGASPTVRNCLLRGNAGDVGGALFVSQSSSTIEDCVVTGNRASGAYAIGGGIYLAQNDGVRFRHCTIAGNTADGSGGGIFQAAADTTSFFACILWGNCAGGAGELHQDDVTSAASFSCSDVREAGVSAAGPGTVDYAGVIDADPLFCAPVDCGTAPTVAGDYRVASISLSLPENNRCGERFGALGEGCAGNFDADRVVLESRVPLGAFPAPPGFANPLRVNDIWGYTSPSGREYAIVGFEVGTGFVEVTDPQNATIVGFLLDAQSQWSDMAVYRQFAYNVNEDDSMAEGVQVIDLSQIDQGVVALAGNFTEGGLRSAHNITINRESGFAYTVLSNVSPGLVAIDLADPAMPALAGTWDSLRVHDVFVASYSVGPFAGTEVAFAACESNGLTIVDVTDKSDMRTISTVTYPNVAYAHQCWLSDDRTTLFLDDELDEWFGQVPTTTTYVVDVADLFNPQIVATFTNGSVATDHNLTVRNTLVYEANYDSGLRVFDARDRTNAVEVGWFDTFPEGEKTTSHFSGLWSFNGAWGVFNGLPSGRILVSDRERGLFVLAFDPLEAGVSPPALDLQVPVNGTASATLTVSNPQPAGVIDLVWEVSEEPAPPEGAGGPDAFGYRWIDSDDPGGPAFRWREISLIGAPLDLADEDSVTVDLPFAFPFYGVGQTRVTIDSNGFFTFDGDLGAAPAINQAIGDPNPPNNLVAPFWDDLDPGVNGAGTVFTFHDATSAEFIVQWYGIPRGEGDGTTYSFQVILRPSGAILFQYLALGTVRNSATIGIENAEASAGLEVAFNTEHAADGMAILLDPDRCPALSEAPRRGVVPPAGMQTIDVTVDAGELPPGTYPCTLRVATNDPSKTAILVPVTVVVEPAVAVEEHGEPPLRFAVHPNRPNPFNPTTEIRYDLPVAAQVTLRIHDVSGRVVRTLVAAPIEPGRHAVRWDGRNDAGTPVASGLYLYRLRAGAFEETRRMMLVR